MLGNKDIKPQFLLTWGMIAFLLGIASLSGSVIAWRGELAFFLLMGILGVASLTLVGLRYERVPFYILVVSFALGKILKIEFTSLSIMVVPGVVTLIILLYNFVIKKVPVVFERRSFALAVVLGIWVLLSAFNAGVSGARGYWLVIILFIMVPNILREEKHFVELGWVLLVSLAIAAGYSIYDFVASYSYAGWFLGAQKLHVLAQTEADIAVTGILSMRITKAIPFAFVLFFSKRRVVHWQRYLIAFCVSLIIITVLVTFSINATIGLLVTLALISFFMGNRFQRRIMVVLTIAVTVVIILSPLMDRLGEQVDSFTKEDSLDWGQGRGVGYFMGWQLMMDSPILGYGPNVEALFKEGYQYIPANYLVRIGAGAGFAYPHNLFLGVGSEIGFVGLLIYLAFVTSVLLPLWR